MPKISTKELIDGLNERNLMAFPQKENKKRVTVSMEDGAGKRHFLSRVATDKTDGEGNAVYVWAKGKKFRDQNK